MFLSHIVSAVALLATLIVAAGISGLITESAFDVAYRPFAWLCFNVLGFVEVHEQWIEIVAMIRAVWLAFVLLDHVS